MAEGTSTNTVETITYLPPHGDNEPRVGTVKDRFGNTTTYAYDDNDGKLSATDSSGRTTETWFDKAMYQIRTKDAGGKETRIQYTIDGGLNRYGEMSSYTDRNGNTTHYERDASGNITRLINPDASTKEYTYDSKSNLLSVKDELGNFIFYVYDVSGVNLLKTAQPLNGTDVYSSDANQNLFAIT
ncbi:MAG: hypothetical protein VB111_11735 [Clostridiaceae bacterium]|nr:hypothetical protein [Clostridiaceae bacterium]